MELSLTGSLPESITHAKCWEKLTRSFSTRPRSERQWIDSPGPEQTRHAHVFCVLIRPPPVPSIHVGERSASEAPSDLREIQMFEYFDVIWVTSLLMLKKIVIIIIIGFCWCIPILNFNKVGIIKVFLWPLCCFIHLNNQTCQRYDVMISLLQPGCNFLSRWHFIGLFWSCLVVGTRLIETVTADFWFIKPVDSPWLLSHVSTSYDFMDMSSRAVETWAQPGAFEEPGGRRWSGAPPHTG